LTNQDSPDWKKAANMFLDRISGRFLKPVRAIESHPDMKIKLFSGFSIIAIDCLIIETLYQFYKGVNETDIEHATAFWHFFRDSVHFSPHFTRRKAKIFYSHFRCGLLHQAQTKMASKIRINENIMIQPVDKKDINIGLIVDRDKFHKALRKEIFDFQNKIKSPQNQSDYLLRDNFVKKMNFIANLVPANSKVSVNIFMNIIRRICKWAKRR
jgi:hypothetical protein